MLALKKLSAFFTIAVMTSNCLTNFDDYLNSFVEVICSPPYTFLMTKWTLMKTM